LSENLSLMDDERWSSSSGIARLEKILRVSAGAIGFNSVKLKRMQCSNCASMSRRERERDKLGSIDSIHIGRRKDGRSFE